MWQLLVQPPSLLSICVLVARTYNLEPLLYFPPCSGTPGIPTVVPTNRPFSPRPKFLNLSPELRDHELGLTSHSWVYTQHDAAEGSRWNFSEILPTWV